MFNIKIKDLPKVKKVKSFKKGDIICHENNWNSNFFCFFNATQDDVDNYSGKNGYYYKQITN